MKYAIVDEKLTVVNIVKWNGQSKWQPPKGMKAIPSDIAQIGDIYDPVRDTFIPDKSRALVAGPQ